MPEPCPSQEQISAVLATKDEVELQSVRKAASIATDLMKCVLIPKVEWYIDEMEVALHQGVSDAVWNAIVDDSGAGLQEAGVVLAIPEGEQLGLKRVSLQSGNDARLAISAESTKGNLPMQGTFLLSLALDYGDYSACIARTLLVDATVGARKAYCLLNEVHGQVIRNLIPGKPFKDVYLAAANFVSENDKALRSKFSDTVGFLMGIELEDPLLVINATSTKKVEAGMNFCVSVGFKSPGPGDQAWAVWIADTVELSENTDLCGVNMTAGSTSLPKDVVFWTGPEHDPGDAGVVVLQVQCAPSDAAEPAPGAADPGGDLAADVSCAASTNAGAAAAKLVRPARKRPPAAEAKPGAVLAIARRSSAATDTAGDHSDQEEEAPQMAKRRPGVGRDVHNALVWSLRAITAARARLATAVQEDDMQAANLAKNDINQVKRDVGLLRVCQLCWLPRPSKECQQAGPEMWYGGLPSALNHGVNTIERPAARLPAMPGLWF